MAKLSLQCLNICHFTAIILNFDKTVISVTCVFDRCLLYFILIVGHISVTSCTAHLLFVFNVDKRSYLRELYKWHILLLLVPAVVCMCTNLACVWQQ